MEPSSPFVQHHEFFRCSLAAIAVQSTKSKTPSKRQQKEKSGEEERNDEFGVEDCPTLGSSGSSFGTRGAQSSLSDRTVMGAEGLNEKKQLRVLKCGIRMQT